MINLTIPCKQSLYVVSVLSCKVPTFRFLPKPFPLDPHQRFVLFHVAPYCPDIANYITVALAHLLHREKLERRRHLSNGIPCIQTRFGIEVKVLGNNLKLHSSHIVYIIDMSHKCWH